MSDQSSNTGARPAVEAIGTGLQRTFAMLAGMGFVLSVCGCLVDQKHFFFSYLTAYSACLTLVLGMMFFVMLHYVADAGWSTVVRRPAEQFLATLWPLSILLLPVLAGMNWLYSWTQATDELAQAKAPFLNVPFFVARAAIYFAVWLTIAWIFRQGSLTQDRTADPRITLRLRRLSAPGLIAYALTLSFASIDWLMSLDYHWYSTVFGVYVWSGATVSSLALLTIVTLALRHGPLRGRLPLDRLHDLGKWTFAFAIFWAYIAFSQYFLIWYANLPEETDWMMHRWTGEDGTLRWWTLSILVPVCLFVVPFVSLMSAATKRKGAILLPVCGIVLLGHYLDCYWLVMPAAYELGPQWHLIWIDVATLALIVGIVGWFWLRAMSQAAMYPIHDPRLPEAVADRHGHGNDGVRHDPTDNSHRADPPKELEMTHGG